MMKINGLTAVKMIREAGHWPPMVGSLYGDPMRSRLAVAFALATLAAAAGCGDNKGVSADAGPSDARPDGPTTDALVCPTRIAGDIGGACSQDSQCDDPQHPGTGFCLNGSAVVGWPAGGYCIRSTFDANNPICEANVDCGAGNVCGNLLGETACMPGCCADDSCAAGAVCTDNFLGDNFHVLACLPGTQAAPDGAACGGFFDCGTNSICNRDALEFPNGQCQSLQCTVGEDTTCASGGDGHCFAGNPSASGPYVGCVDACQSNADCREAEGYTCFDGGADAGKFCRHPQAGDACIANADCGAPNVWTCHHGEAFGGGYCTVIGCVEDGDGCSPGSSFCFDVANDSLNDDNLCVDRCANASIGTQSSCRVGYSCADVNRGAAVVGGCLPSF